jgi:hypothetical protein
MRQLAAFVRSKAADVAARGDQTASREKAR